MFGMCCEIERYRNKREVSFEIHDEDYLTQNPTPPVVSDKQTQHIKAYSVQLYITVILSIWQQLVHSNLVLK